MTDAVVQAAVARLSAALPDWHDATGTAHPTPESSLPSFAVRVTISDSERLSMGDPRAILTGQLEIGFELATPVDTEAGLHRHAREIATHLLTPDDDLGGAVWSILLGSVEAEHDAGATTISRGDLIMPIEVIE